MSLKIFFQIIFLKTERDISIKSEVDAHHLSYQDIMISRKIKNLEKIKKKQESNITELLLNTSFPWLLHLISEKFE